MTVKNIEALIKINVASIFSTIFDILPIKMSENVFCFFLHKVRPQKENFQLKLEMLTK